jgi:hypothetical protein
MASMFSRRLTRSVAAGAAALAVAAGGVAIANSGSGNGASGSATAAQTAAPAQASRTGQAPGAGAAKAAPTGTHPKGWTEGSGTIITGKAADKVKALASARYAGTVNRVLKLSDGSYVAHLFANPSGPHHIFVSKSFKITGTV